MTDLPFSVHDRVSCLELPDHYPAEVRERSRWYGTIIALTNVTECPFLVKIDGRPHPHPAAAHELERA